MRDFNKKLFTFLFLTVFMVFFYTGASWALSIGVDYDDLILDSYTLLDEFSSSSSIFSNTGDQGTLDVDVYYKSGLYLYTFDINPSGTEHLSKVSAQVYGDYGVGGEFENLMAGYSHADAGKMAFTTSFTKDVMFGNTIDFTLTPGNDWSSSGNIISFYFESVYAPGQNYYFITNGSIKYTNNYGPDPESSFIPPSPVPEPGTMMLVLTGLGCISGMRLKKTFSCRK